MKAKPKGSDTPAGTWWLPVFRTRRFSISPGFRFCWKRILQAALVGWLCGAAPVRTFAQDAGIPQEAVESSVPRSGDVSLAPAKVDVKPTAKDEEIGQRLLGILEATDWFDEPKVRVEEGVVFLEGGVTSEKLKEWAGDLARNTQDVAAVVNRMNVTPPSIWDFRPASSGLLALWRDVVRSLPFFGFGLVILALSLGAGMLAARAARVFLRSRIQVRLLRSVIAAAIGSAVFLFGTYIVLRISGLTQLALTVVGGTGLVGLAVGIAFRDITENFLASIFLSVQRPFEKGDLVEVAGVTGYVQQLNVRTTILMTLDGNLVQIPNASVYKSNLRNFTTNANRREDFTVGIGYDDSIEQAQEIARVVLADHPAVLADPEPSVLAESLGNATVNLRIYFWINGRNHSWLKVRSSLIRLVKLAYQKEGISMPDEAREVIFPQGIPIIPPAIAHKEEPQDSDQANSSPREPLPEGSAAASTKAEGGFDSEAGVIKHQAQLAKPLQEEENLLTASSSKTSQE